MFAKELALILAREDFAVYLLLPANSLWTLVVNDELQPLLFNIAERGFVENAHLVRWNAVKCRQFFALKLPRLDELRFVGRYSDLLPRNAALQKYRLACFLRRCELFFERTLEVILRFFFHYSGIFKDSRWPRRIGIKTPAKCLCCQPHGYSLARHVDRRVSPHTIEAHAGSVQHIERINLPLLAVRR